MGHSRLDQLADHLDRIALQIADRKPSKAPDIDARFLVIAADALRELGGQVVEIAALGHELESLSVGKSGSEGK